MDGTAVQQIAKLREESLELEVDGIKYASPNLEPILFEPHPEGLKLETLQGLVDLLDEPIDKELENREELLIHVVSYKKVRLYGELAGRKRQRDLYAEVNLSDGFETFPFSRFMVSEEFQIKLRSLLVPTEDQELLLQFTSRLTVTDEVVSGDDGMTQEVSLRRGMSGALKESGSFKPIVSLKPYRTFREIDQPESQLLFRMKAEEGKIPTLALFEADGGKWKIEAVQRVAEYFLERLDGIKVVS